MVLIVDVVKAEMVSTSFNVIHKPELPRICTHFVLVCRQRQQRSTQVMVVMPSAHCGRFQLRSAFCRAEASVQAVQEPVFTAL